MEEKNITLISVIAGATVVIIVGILVVNYFKSEEPKMFESPSKTYNVNCEKGIEEIEFNLNGSPKNIKCIK